MTGDRRKRSVTHPHCYAKLVFADPRYTDSVPYPTTVSAAPRRPLPRGGGMGSPPACGDVPSLFAEKAFPLLASGLAALAAHPGELPGTGQRDALYYASLCAGMVLNATAPPSPILRVYPHRGLRHPARTSLRGLPPGPDKAGGGGMPRPGRPTFFALRRAGAVL